MALPRDAIRNTSEEENDTRHKAVAAAAAATAAAAVIQEDFALDVHQLDNGTSDAWSAKRFTGL